MDQKGMIEDIIARVMQKVNALEAEPVQEDFREPDDDRPGLLILTQEHRETCHRFYDSAILAEHYAIDCALLKDYEVNMDDYEVVLMFGLTIEALGKLAAGIYDTPYTRLAAQAILTGKRIVVPQEEVELFRYAETAPAPYYAMLQQKLALLTDSGVCVVKADDVESCVVSGKAPKPCPCAAEPAREDCRKEFRLNKRVITERDISEAAAAKAACVYIPCRSIVTDLAKEYAKARDISLIRE